MRLPVALAAGALLLAGLAFVPTASASCMEVGHAAILLTCVACPLTSTTDTVCGIERSANAYAVCYLDTAPSQWLAACV